MDFHDTMHQNFISQHEFQAASSRVERWGDLPLYTIYRIDEINEREINGEQIRKYVVLTNRDGEVINVWLTSVIEKELQKYDIHGKEKIYIQSLGLKKSKANKDYFDFQIVKH